ncbi:MAG: hypothetical protein KKE17_08155 [Proteobacteria bacterium]|nr:hypothetical protein [Pseudomonadota bacterium]MBU1709959.1 hypothetical protein [Pseudomonadota bacterium]
MKEMNDIWEDLGSLAEHEMLHVMTKLFVVYEEMVKRDPANGEALNFFKHLGVVIDQTKQCNLNRR